MLATWSVTQSIQALSSGEAEFYAVLRGAVEALGLAATAEEMGFPFRKAPRVGSDSSAARGTAGRHGVGKLKHVDLKRPWSQAVLKQGRLGLAKQDGKTNFADLMTQHLAAPDMERLLEAAGFEFRDGRAAGALELAKGAARRRIAAILGEFFWGLDCENPGFDRRVKRG